MQLLTVGTPEATFVNNNILLVGKAGGNQT